MADQIKLALACFQSGNLDDALSILNKVISEPQSNALAWFLKAIIHMQQNDAISAINGFEKAIEIQPNYPEAFNNLGVALEENSQPDQASVCYKKAIKKKTDYANAYYNLANIEKNERKFDNAIDNYLLAIKFQPNYTNAMNNLALIYQYHGNYTKSKTLFKQALESANNDQEITNNLGYNYFCLHQYEKALTIFEGILSNMPDYTPTLLNCGVLMQAMGKFGNAREYFLRASRNPQHHTQAMNNLAYLELSIENFEAGWQYYRFRPSVRNLHFQSLDKLPTYLNGKSILLYKDQGIGDEVFFARYIPALNQYGANISYYTDEKLAEIWNRSLTGIHILTKIPDLKNFDFVISIGDLPRLLFQNGYTDIPDSIEIKPDPIAVEKIKNLLPNNGKQTIAVTWEAGVPGHNTLFKRLPPDIFGGILSSSEANILIIQRQPKQKDLKAFEKNLGKKTFNYSFVNDNLEDMLALLSLVDDYYCVSNTNNHLRAALNLTSQVFVPHPPEWRWLNDGVKSPWFPNSKINRQDSYGNWNQYNESRNTDCGRIKNTSKIKNKN